MTRSVAGNRSNRDLRSEENLGLSILRRHFTMLFDHSGIGARGLIVTCVDELDLKTVFAAEIIQI